MKNKGLTSQWTADEFNRLFPVGTTVRFQPVAGIEKYEESRTRTIAWTLGSGEPVVSIEGRAGGVSLGHITIVAVECRWLPGAEFPPSFLSEHQGKPLSKEWTPVDRLRVITAILPGLEDDIYAGAYSKSGRPNVTSLQHLIHDEALELEPYRWEFEVLVADYERRIARRQEPQPEPAAESTT